MNTPVGLLTLSLRSSAAKAFNILTSLRTWRNVLWKSSSWGIFVRAADAKSEERKVPSSCTQLPRTPPIRRRVIRHDSKSFNVLTVYQEPGPGGKRRFRQSISESPRRCEERHVTASNFTLTVGAANKTAVYLRPGSFWASES